MAKVVIPFRAKDLVTHTGLAFSLTARSMAPHSKTRSGRTRGRPHDGWMPNVPQPTSEKPDVFQPRAM
ncbi:hypothetical protein VSDG_02505 [Cytospora chrysosperma]|uniref:Uncharacterized protein n=1 Tax=Cytospora chrysosperma TaxID=252740 RepID=A0A423WF86_CYTCH|nr:hypothetical protein VSDG_02505 [Valsa sordida]